MKIQEQIISENDDIRTAAERLEKSELKNLFVIDSNDKLIGSITDGDIRRGLLKGHNLNSKVLNIMNKRPFFLKENMIDLSMVPPGIEVVPILNSNNKLIDLIQTSRTFSYSKENDVIIMAGGLGSRLGELTKDTPKPMLKVGDRPILQRVVDQIKLGGYKNFHLAVNYKSEQIKNYFGDGSDFDINVKYLEEEKRLGTAGALSLYESNSDLPFIVSNADVITDINFSELMAYHNLNELDITVCTRAYSYQVPFGVIKTENGFVESFQEKPTMQYNVAAGIYVLNQKVKELIPMEDFFDMPHLIDSAIKAGMKVKNFSITSYWIDVGRGDDLEKARGDFS